MRPLCVCGAIGRGPNQITTTHFALYRSLKHSYSPLYNSNALYSSV